VTALVAAHVIPIEASHAALAARLDELAATADAGHAAIGAPHLARMRLARRTHLSLGEEVLSIPFLSKRSTLSYLSQRNALPLRGASRACREAVAAHTWDLTWDRSKRFVDTRIKGSLAAWRRCFPNATFANISKTAVTDATACTCAASTRWT